MKAKKADFTLSFATYQDVHEIEPFLYEYFKESGYSDGLTYDADTTKATIAQWIPQICVLARVDGQLAGIFAMYFTHTYYKEPECDVIIFYVSPEYRGTGVSRGLVNALTAISDKNGAAVIYTSSASGISSKNNKMYANLFTKFGFEDLGTELIRKNV